jgi:ABC-type branched-subunit amino acid transport system substrate-binding protein
VKKLVVVISAENEWGASQNQIRDSVRRAVAKVPEKFVVDFKPADQAPSQKADRAAAAEAEALSIARSQDADAACVVNVAECGWLFKILGLPPAWALDNHLDYSVRVLDTASGKPLLTATRQRRNGGLFALYVPRLLPQFESGVRDDLRPLLSADGRSQRR